MIVPALFAFAGPLASLSPPPLPVFFIRGDANADIGIDVTDAIGTIDFLFLGGSEPPCLKSADVNDDTFVDITDVVHLLYSMYLGGEDPAGPYPDCGSDPSEDGLGCGFYPFCEFESLVSSYSNLKTVAGKGALANDAPVNEWNPSYEGGPATEAELSAPHFAMGDDEGNFYIADKDAHAIRKVLPGGTIVTVAGTGEAGDDGDEPGPGTGRRLSSPNGLWVRGDSTVYILDMGNGKVRRLDPSGSMSTLFTVAGGIAVGRGIWVRDDEKLAYFSSFKQLKKWTPENGVEVLPGTYNELGNLVVDPWGSLVVTDRGDHRVWRIDGLGGATPIAGNGTTAGGGSGQLALDTGLAGVRGVWFLPHGGYFLATHAGNQVWYVDTQGIIHLFLNGRKDSHSGDGQAFNSPGFKVSEVRSVSVDASGNVLVTEHDAGFVRMVERRQAGGS